MGTTKIIFKSFLSTGFLLVFFLILAPNNASAATYYIPDDFGTLQAAADVANPGDIFYVRNGSYNQKVNITRSGSAGNYISFISENDKGATIDGGSAVPSELDSGLVKKGDWAGIFTIRGASYIKISGFRIVDSGYVGVRINGSGTSRDIIVENNYINNTYSSALYAEDAGPNIVFDRNEVTGSHVKPMPGENEIVDMVNVDGYEIKYNYIHDNVSAESIDVKIGARNGLIHHNRIKPDASAGIYLDAWNGNEDNNRVYDNIIYGGGAGVRGIAMAVECGGRMDGAYIYNNIVYNNGAYGIVVALYTGCDPLSCCIGGPMNNIQVFNNTVYNNDNISHWGGGISNDNTRADATNIVFRNNIVSQNSNQIRDLKGTVIIENNLIDGASSAPCASCANGSPQFATPGSDFHLLNTSPAIDTGSATGAPGDDYDGAIRPVNGSYDIGAYEFGGVPAVCVPNGCGGGCPAGCTGADDPDCGGQCLDNTCATDTDCAPPPPPPGCTPDGCNNNCPAGCAGADDPDCGGQCLDNTCATDTDCAPPPPPPPPLCAPDMDDPCTSAYNDCGDNSTGTIQCNGSCSAITPPNPPNYGDICSTTNACGAVHTGTIQCDGSCSAIVLPVAMGGVVPCGRMCDNPATSWDESQPCNFCHLVLVFQLLIEFLVKLGSVAAVFGIAIGGLMHFFSVGDPGRMQGGRQAIRYSLLGFVVIFAAWAIIETILMSLGYIDPLGGKWFEVLCSLP